MAYLLSPRLFVENGPAILASRRLAVRFTAHEYALLKPKADKDPKTAEPPFCRAA